jgi:hypothetical protein
LVAGLAPPEPEPELAPALPPPEEAELDELLNGELLDVVLVVVVDVVVVVVGGVLATVEVGTVSGGALDVSAAVVPPPPQPASTAESASGAQTSESFLITARLLQCRLEPSGLKRLHPPAAVRAVVQVLLGVLVAPVAEAEVLDRPGQLGERGGERKQLGDDAQLLACFAVDVDAVWLRFDDDFAAGRGSPHPVLLARPHSMPC